MPLTDVQIRSAKPGEKPRKLFDGGGLYLLVTPEGGRWWRLKYRFGGKEKLLSLGTYPTVGLRDARERRDAAKKKLAAKVDPMAERKTAPLPESFRFEAVAREWHKRFKGKWTEGHAADKLRLLERDVLPWVGAVPAGSITAKALLEVVRRIEDRGALETAHKALQICGQVLRYAVASGKADRNVAVDLRGSLPVVRPVHHASITAPDEIGALLRAIDGYQGEFVTKCALRLAPLVFTRPGELRAAEWPEFNLDAAEWRIPPERMKMHELHLVPLARQAVAILRELWPLTGTGRFVFPGLRSRARPMSNNTVNAALRRMGFERDEMTGHGFRSMASTLLNEHGWNRDAIERQLAHSERDEVRAAYNFAEHLPERRRMMQWWADHLDGLKKLKR